MKIIKYIKKVFIFLFLFIVVFTTSSCDLISKIDPGDFNDYSARLLKTLLGNDELTLHFLFNDKEALGITDTKVSLPTPGTTSALGKLIINLYFGPMKNYNYEELNFDEKMTYNVIVDLLDRINKKTSDMAYLDNNYLGSYLGYQAQLPILLQQYRFNNLDDVHNYFELLKLVPETFETYYNYEVEKSEKGFGMPDYVIDKVVDQCVEFVNDKEEHFLITTFPQRIAKFNLTEQEEYSLIEENKNIIQNTVCSGYEYIRDNLPNLKGKATNNLGLCYYKTTLSDGTVYELGKEYYEYLFTRATGYEVEMEDAIAYMQLHLDNIISEIKDIKERRPNINEEIENIQLMNDDVYAQMEIYKNLIINDFPTIEEYPTISILNVDPALEDHFSPAAYVSSPIDDYSHEAIYLNQKKINGDMNYLYTTLAHEGIPGHMYQNIFFKGQDVNLIRKVLKNSGYQEGWATYVELYMYDFVEDLDEDILLYMKDYDILNGVLTARLDMGIHYQGWDENDIYDYLSQYFGGYDNERCVRILQQLAEVPTNSQSYYYTYFKLCDMRERVMNALGDNYDPIAFHKLILDCGPLPLRFVEVVVDEYIASFGN